MYQKNLFLIVFSLFLLSALAQTEAQSEEIIWTKRTLNDLGIKGDVMNAIFSPDDSRICVTTTKTFVELEPANGEIIREIPDIRGVKCFSDDGKFFYTYDLKKVNYETMEIVGEFELPVDAWTDQLFWTVSGFEVNEKSGLLIAWARQANQMPLPKESIFIYDLNTYQQIKITGLEGNYMAGMVISPNGEYFITYSQYNPDLSTDIEDRVVIMLWETAKLDTIKELEQPTPRGYMKFSPDGNLLGSVSGNLVRVHDTKTWEMKYEFMHNPNYGRLTALDFTSDSKYLATGGYGGPDDYKFHIWNVTTGELAYIYEELGNPELFAADRIFYSNNDKHIIGSSSGKLAFFNSHFSGSYVYNHDFNGDSIIYPNPSSGKIEFEDGSLRIGQLSIQLSDVNGKQLEILYDETYNGEFLSFDISYLPNGIYFITVTQKDYVHTYKLIKE
jgi:WD40 repeat protein